MLLRMMPIMCSVVALVTLSVCTALPTVAQKTAPAKDGNSKSTASDKQSPDNAVGETQIKLDRRANSEYEKSAYSFRYKTQSKSKHKNYVDVVYSANGNLRINNHGGMECKIIDLGGEIGNGFDLRKVKNNDWQKIQIKPVTGHYYAYHVQVQKHQMTGVFKVDQLSETQMGITVWYQKGKNRWPVSAASRGAAGTSGMSRGRSSAR